MKKKILLVEDSSTTQRLLYFILSKEFEIHIAGNGYEAMLWLQSRQTPDLVIMDWHMPYMDGPSFIKNLKISGLYCDIPIIVLSNLQSTNEELNTLAYHADKCLTKPFDPFLLKQTIEDLISVGKYGVLD